MISPSIDVVTNLMISPSIDIDDEDLSECYNKFNDDVSVNFMITPSILMISQLML
jgi:hypothetical protein